ncbi:hypothetical protein GCM10025864_33500 [Luteimicrobium album]|uniref:Uncharacterized protein n=1 Tax=Luteimicrobium album TaxID=1054550 RepID=A0ABQ6I5P7_9MICO|nr:hypothetical protein GCM10025864_33500 [Luteimicrobium album]
MLGTDLDATATVNFDSAAATSTIHDVLGQDVTTNGVTLNLEAGTLNVDLDTLLGAPSTVCLRTHPCCPPRR